MAELVHAVVILAHFHALASFVFGSGINPQVDTQNANGFQAVYISNYCTCDLASDHHLDRDLSSTSPEVRFNYVCLEGLCWKCI